MPAGGEDPVISAERAHLTRSREFLRLMREHVLAINPMAGDPVSLEYLKADLYRRAESLKDIPDAPLFFGRLDYDEEGAFHIGRRHVHDQDGTPVVIDWRAPVSRPFYRASQADPMGIALRRRFGFSGAAAHRLRRRDLHSHGRYRRRARTFRRKKDQPAAHRGNRAAEIRADARHRRHHPARPGRHRARRRQPDRVRAGRAGHREDGRRAAPRRLPAVRAQGAGDQARRHRRRAEPRLPLLHQERPARPRRTRRNPDHRHRTGGLGPGARRRQRRGRPGQGRRADGRRAAPRALGGDQAAADALVLPRGSRRWRVPASEIAELAGELRNRGVRYGAGRNCSGTASRT